MLSLLIATQVMAGTAAPPCRAAQVRLSLDARDGDFNGMSHAGVALSIRNVGGDCTLPALPTIGFRDARGRPLPASRRMPVGMHPGPVMLPVRLAGGHRAAAELRWVAGPVFAHNRTIKPASLTVRIGDSILHVPLTAVLYGDVGKPFTFDQTPLHAVEGMAAH